MDRCSPCCLFLQVTWTCGAAPSAGVSFCSHLLALYSQKLEDVPFTRCLWLRASMWRHAPRGVQWHFRVSVSCECPDLALHQLCHT